MTSNYTSRYKPHPGNNKLNIVFTIANYSLLQKLLSAVFLIIVCRTYLLFIIGLGCNLKNSNPSKAIKDVCKIAGLANRPERCIATVTTLGMGDAIGYMRLNQDRSKRLHAAHPTDEAIPNWETYGIAPFTFCQRGGSGYTHTFSLDVDGAKFQNGEALGFILVKNNRSPADLVKYLLKKHIPWPDQLCTYMHIKDYLILPVVIGQDVLQYAYHFDPLTDLNSYTHSYCYIKKGPHYCFIPLINRVAEASTTYSRPIRLPKEMPAIAADQASLDSGIDVAPESPLSLETGKPLDALATMHEGATEPTMHHKETLGRTTILTKIQTGILDITNRTIQALNNLVNQEERPVLSNKIEPALRPALQAIANLELALKPIATLGEAAEGAEKLHSSKLIELTTPPAIIIESLTNLEKAVTDQHKEISGQEAMVWFVEELLNLMLSSLNNIHTILLPHNEFKTIDESASTDYSLQELLIGDGIPLEKVEKIILYLKKMQSDQLDMINDLKEVKNELLALAITDRLQKMETRLDTLVMELALDEIPLLSSLKRKLQVDIVEKEGKYSISNIKDLTNFLSLSMDQAKEIFDTKDLDQLATAIKRVVHKVLDLENKFQTEVVLKIREMINQTDKLIHSCHDSMHQERVVLERFSNAY